MLTSFAFQFHTKLSLSPTFVCFAANTIVTGLSLRIIILMVKKAKKRQKRPKNLSYSEGKMSLLRLAFFQTLVFPCCTFVVFYTGKSEAPFWSPNLESMMGCQPPCAVSYFFVFCLLFLTVGDEESYKEKGEAGWKVSFTTLTLKCLLTTG